MWPIFLTFPLPLQNRGDAANPAKRLSWEGGDGVSGRPVSGGSIAIEDGYKDRQPDRQQFWTSGSSRS